MKLRPLGSFAALFVLAACASTPPPEQHVKPTDSSAPVAAPTNPFFEESKLAFHVPPFDKITDKDFMPAFEKGMADHLAEVKAIAHDPAPATFENTIVALERSGALLTRVSKAFFNLNSSNGSDALSAIETEITPKLSAHEDAVLLDSALFARIDGLYQKRAELKLDPESAQLLERYEKEFIRAGAKLSDTDKAALAKVNEELSTLTTDFRQRVLECTKEGAVVVDDEKSLAGLSPADKSAALEAAKARGLTGKWLITLQNTTIQPPLGTLEDRALREKIFKASSGRCVGGKSDTTADITKILKLRAKKAGMFGYPNYAAYAIAEETAETPEAAQGILKKLIPAALAKAKSEATEIQAMIDKTTKAAKEKSFELEPWDWDFYSQKVQREKYSFDEAEVRPYFSLEHVLVDGVFFAAHELYGISFKERKDIAVYQPDVRVFEVTDEDGSPLALLLVDYYKRDSKQGGAWMDTFVDQSKLLGYRPVVINNLNVPKPAAGEPALLSFDDVTTIFHEFGHSLHGMLSNGQYPTISGTATPPDFVEFPSQFNEMWTRDPVVLAHFAKHYKTGEAMPKALLDKILAAQTWGQGYASLEYLAAASADISFHQAAEKDIPTPENVMAFEADALTKAGSTFAAVPPRYHAPYFQHIFASDGYAAGYYAYIWSEVLARDAGAWFTKNGGLTRANGKVFRDKILSRGRTKEPSVLFSEFYGGPPDIAPLAEYRGLVLTTK
ncbi:MAG: M3 family metallopeptidase [Polyangiaceae bacterium]